MTTQEIKHILTTYHIAPLKSLSQNFFVDTPLLRKILTKLDIPSSDTVVEIGPGLGSLTEVLVKQYHSVLAFEIDQTMARILPEILDYPDNLTVYHQDILTAQEHLHLSEPFQVIANVPYHITGAIIHTLLTLDHPPQSITLLLQEEVAINLIEPVPPYSFQRLSTDIYATAEGILRVPPEAFYPRPQVYSAVIRLHPHQEYAFCDREAVLAFIKPIFQRKRKQVKSSLKKVHNLSPYLLDDLWSSLNLDPGIRPQDVSLDVWIEIYNRVHHNTAKI